MLWAIALPDVTYKWEKMPRNKARLQLALSARPKHHGTYHYALLIAPKCTRHKQINAATKHHVKNTIENVSGKISQPWRYERLDVSEVRLEQRLLVRIIIAKVISPPTLEGILEAVPLRQIDDPDQAAAQQFTCLTWVRSALEAARIQSAITGLGEWDEIQRKALAFVQEKKQLGRWNEDWKGEEGMPMLDLLDGSEIIG